MNFPLFFTTMKNIGTYIQKLEPFLMLKLKYIFVDKNYSEQFP
jgi:hypothetical protein